MVVEVALCPANEMTTSIGKEKVSTEVDQDYRNIWLAMLWQNPRWIYIHRWKLVSTNYVMVSCHNQKDSYELNGNGRYKTIRKHQ